MKPIPSFKKALLIAAAAGLFVFFSSLLFRVTPSCRMQVKSQNDTAKKLSVDFGPFMNPPVKMVSEGAGYKNLQVFLIYADEGIQGDRYITLDSALNGKLATVKETSNVQELKMDNPSQRYIYINSGDIVRGGKQDRTIQFDVVIGPGMKDVDLASFCVERGRWNQREGEGMVAFSRSENTLSSKELKLAAKKNRSQSQVWQKVSQYQDSATVKMKKNYRLEDSYKVNSDASNTSLELTLENDAIKKVKDTFRQQINGQLPVLTGAVGLACFINGKMASVDVYNNHFLFKAMYTKLLESAIAEAISLDDGKEYTPAESASVNSCFSEFNSALSRDVVNSFTRFNSFSGTDSVMLFISEDLDKNTWLHKNWLKDDVKPEAPAQINRRH